MDDKNVEPAPAILSAPEDLAGMIACQPGAIVSRVLLKNESGSLTLFAFDADQGLSEHSTPHEAVAIVLEGTAEIHVGGRPNTVGAGQSLHLPAGVSHAVHAPHPLKMLLIMLRRSLDS